MLVNFIENFSSIANSTGLITPVALLIFTVVGVFWGRNKAEHPVSKML